jgi:pimeloyl-ACP methyl ester carboxylesterase
MTASGWTIVLAALALAVPAAVSAEPVQIKPSLLRLNGNLELAEGRTEADGAAVVLHGALSHHGHGTIEALQKNLRERGITTLAITLSLGIDSRQGDRACDVVHDYALAGVRRELGLWIAWLNAQGARAIDLVGFSQGGAQVAALAREFPAVRSVVLLAPTFASADELAEAYQRRYGIPLAPRLERAKAAPLQKSIVDFLSCPQAPVLGLAFLDGYREFPARLAAETGRSTLVVIAGSDDVVPGLEAKLPADARRVIIDGAGHLFADRHGEQAADAIAGFLKEQ